MLVNPELLMPQASAETLMTQAGETAGYWLRQAVEIIDDVFGKDYAKKHPDLVAGFMIAASNDQIAMYISELKQTNAEIAMNISELKQSVEEFINNSVEYD